MRYRNICEMIKLRAESSGASVAMIQRERGRWREMTWNEAYSNACKIAAGLRSMGIQRGDTVCVFAQTRLEWTLCDWGVLGCGAINVPLSPAVGTDEFQYVINSVNAKVLFVEDANSFDKIYPLLDKLPEDLQLVVMEGSSPEEQGAISLKELIRLGEKHDEDVFEKTSEEIASGDIATILFSAYGSSAESMPKGVVLTHGNLLEQQYSLGEVFLPQEGQRTLLILPLSHIFGRTIGLMGPYAGLVTIYLKNYDRLVEIMREMQPVFVAGVPRFFEKLDESIWRTTNNSSIFVRRIFRRVLKVGLRVSRRRQRNRPIQPWLEYEYRILRNLLLDKIHKQLGGKLRFCICSGSPLKRELLEFFHALDLLVIEAYGMAEFSGVATINRPGDYRFGTVGRPLPGCRVELADDGELLVKAPFTFREYWQDKESTAQAIKDSWVYTGDIGEMDEDGFIRITDRKNDIISTATGRNVAPRRLEHLLGSVPFVRDAVVYGERRNFLTAIITLDINLVENYAHANGIYYKEKEELADDPAIRRVLEEAVESVNQQVSYHERIQKFAILKSQFSTQSGELTPTRKLRRKFLYEKYREIWESFYQ